MKLPKHMILSGGGIYGIHMSKILHCIERKVNENENLLTSLKLESISCTSVGSILGCAILCGYFIKELIDNVLIDFDFMSCLSFDMSYFIKEYGSCSQDTFVSYLQKMIDIKYPNRGNTLTFQELYNDTNCIFYISVTNLSKEVNELWSHLTHPNLPVIKALQISCCIPVLFPPVIQNNNMYIDGGILNNFPHDKVLNNREYTLGISADCIPSSIHEEANINNMEDYIFKIMKLIYCRSYNVHKQLFECDKTNTIYIENCVNKLDIKASLDSSKLFNIFIQYKVNLDDLSFFNE